MKAKYKVLGLTKSEFDSLRSRYQLIKHRCYNIKDVGYDRYGGRGITMCDEWKNSCDTFYKWAVENGYRKELTIDRINPNRNYEPSNCRWVNYYVQNKNKKNIKLYDIDNEKLTLSEISRKYKISFKKLEDRVINRKMDIIIAINYGDKFIRYPKKLGQFSKDGELIKVYDRQKDACDELGIKPQNMSICTKNFNKTTGGFRWQYLN